MEMCVGPFLKIVRAASFQLTKTVPSVNWEDATCTTTSVVFFCHFFFFRQVVSTEKKRVCFFIGKKNMMVDPQTGQHSKDNEDDDVQELSEEEIKLLPKNKKQKPYPAFVLLDLYNGPKDKKVHTGQTKVSWEDATGMTDWQLSKSPHGYAQVYLSGSPTGQYMLLHHMIVGFPEDGCVVDHINHDRLDNRRENLRTVSYSQNAQNALKKRKDTTSTFIGVSKIRIRFGFEWRATIMCNGERYTATFATELEAAKAYDRWALYLFGEQGANNGTLSEDERKQCLLQPTLPPKANHRPASSRWFRPELPNDQEPITRYNGREAYVTVNKKFPERPQIRCFVDDDVWHRVVKQNWYTTKAGRDPVASVNGKTVTLQKFIWELSHPPDPSLCIRSYGGRRSKSCILCPSTLRDYQSRCIKVEKREHSINWKPKGSTSCESASDGPSSEDEG